MTTLYLQRMRAIPRDAWLAMTSYVLIYLNYFGVAGVLQNLYLLRMGYDVRYVGLVSAVLLATYAAGCPLAGFLGRRWGPRRPMIWGMGVAAVGATLFALGDLLPLGVRTTWLPIANGLAGLGFALPAVDCSVYLRATCGDTGCDHAFAVRGALATSAALIGSLIGGLLPLVIAPLLGITDQDPAAYRWPLLGSGLMIGLGMVTLWPAREVDAPPSRPSGQRTPASALPLVTIAILMLFMLLRSIADTPPSTFMNVYMDTRLGATTATIGLVRGLGQILCVPALLLMPLVTTRWGRAPAMVACLLGRALVSLALALLPNALLAAVCFVLTPALFGFTEAVLGGYQQSLVAVEWRSMMVGLASLAGGGTGAAVALGGGHLIASFGYVELFLISAGAALVSAASLWAYDRRRTPLLEGA